MQTVTERGKQFFVHYGFLREYLRRFFAGTIKVLTGMQASLYFQTPDAQWSSDVEKKIRPIFRQCVVMCH